MGRKKKFEETQVLDRALEVFWENGFERSSLSSLTEATGLHKGSLYSSFKSKENLFSLCLTRYAERMANHYSLSSLNAKTYIRQFFEKKINHPAKRKRLGCFLMNSGLEMSHLGSSSGEANIQRLLKSVEVNFKTAVQSGVEQREFSEEIVPQKMAERLFALAFTIEELGKVGKSKEFLRNLANSTLRDLDIKI